MAAQKAPEGMKLCHECMSPLHINARMCPHCKQPQDWWRRNIAVLTALYSAITISLAAITFVVPFAEERLRPEYGAEVKSIAADPKTYTVSVKNTGKTPLVLTSAQARFPGGDVEMAGELEDKERVIKVGETQILQLHWPSAALRPQRLDVEQSADCATIISFSSGTLVYKLEELSAVRECKYDFVDFLTGRTGR